LYEYYIVCFVFRLFPKISIGYLRQFHRNDIVNGRLIEFLNANHSAIPPSTTIYCAKLREQQSRLTRNVALKVRPATNYECARSSSRHTNDHSRENGE